MRLKDSLSQTLKEIDQKRPVKIYCCGPTVYDYPHLGNWYAFLRWDLLIRTLKSCDYKILWVMNITDVGHLTSDADQGEDKLVQKARSERKSAYQIADYYTNYFLNALKRLNFTIPNYLPKASQHIKEQIDLIKKLEAKNLTYIIDDGVYCDTSLIADYGKLAQTNRQGFEAGARVEYNPQKKNTTDFALWKFSPIKQKRDMEWDSPWGRGFPGWHLECSAMAEAYLDTPLDIHAGGIDHIPIHHTNELAQSEAAYDKTLAKIWLHSNFITIEGQKMSKSLNNFYTLEDIEEKGYDLQALRLAVFASRYFNQVDFNWQILDQANQRLKRWQSLAVRRFQLDTKKINSIEEKLKNYLTDLLESLKDNLNSPKALEIVDQVCSTLNSQVLSADCQLILTKFCQTLDDLFGLKLMTIPDLNQQQRVWLKTRQAARLNKNFEQSDHLRQKLLETGLQISDMSFGQIWHF